MAKGPKRRVKKNRQPHKSSGTGSGINWGRIAIIAIGIIIALSMVLSLIVIPGSGF